MKEQDNPVLGHIYVCGICNSAYSKSELAQECEKSHVGTSRISDEYYDSMGRYPTTIKVTMNDRVVIRYSMEVERNGENGD